MPDEPSTEVLRKEEAFHDKWADETDLDSVEVVAAFEGLAAQENQFILGLLGDMTGKSVLDVGTGLGESAIYFATRGARVTAVDLSSRMIELCLENAKRFGVEVEGIVTAGEDLELEEDRFDVVYAANIIHHITDRETFYRNMHRVLKPGGTFVAWDPIAYNPVINVYRSMATEVRTDDESPLTFAEFELSGRFFPDLEHREFWLSTLVLFLKYFLLDRHDPNKVRYWKRILEETPATIGWWFTPLAACDRVLLRLPLIRRLAWNTVQWGTKPG